MYELKLIARDAIPQALAKAERYRLLNEPREAESICRDVLAVDPGNPPATICLILALTDLFTGLEVKADDARALAARLPGGFEREYYAGVVEERWGKALLAAGYPEHSAHALIREAMAHFDRADALAPPGNDDAALRWNACVRMLARAGLTSEVPESPDPDDSGDDNAMLDDDVPPR